MADSIYPHIAPFKDVRDIHYSELTEDILTSPTPLILRGLISSWPVVQQSITSAQSAIDYIKQFYNQNPVHTMLAEPEIGGRLFYNEALNGFNFTRQNLNLTDVLDSIFRQFNQPNAPTYYVGSTSIDHILPGFRADNDIPLLADKPLKSIWIGNRSRIAAHFDVTDNIACCVAGTRRFTVFPPEQSDNLYVGPLDFTPAGQPASLVDFAQPDYQRYPKFKQALENGQTALLYPGDAIFIPSMWWHHVEGLDDFNVLVNYWWRQVDNHLAAPADALDLALLSIKDLPEEQRQAWKKIFNDYVFSPTEKTHIPEAVRGSLNPIDELTARKLRATLINKLNR